MALNLYLDDCSNSDLLADLLRQGGHRVTRPTDDEIGLTGEEDHVHFGFAAGHGLTVITKNPADFKALHDLDQRHAGILGAAAKFLRRDFRLRKIRPLPRNVAAAFFAWVEYVIDEVFSQEEIKTSGKT